LTVIEQRKSRRFELILPFELVRSGSRTLLAPGETRNVSSCGVLFHSPVPVQPGDTVEYAITLPSGSKDTEVRLRCRGKIVRRTENSEAAATMDRWEFIRRQI
jgi:hypothetical protein